MRQFRLLSTIVGGKPQEYFDSLKETLGEVVDTSDPSTGYDHEGMSQLKALLGKRG